MSVSDKHLRNILQIRQEVTGDPAALRAAATSLAANQRHFFDSADTVRRVRGDLKGAWSGDAANAADGRLGVVDGNMNELAATATGSAEALYNSADVLDRSHESVTGIANNYVRNASSTRAVAVNWYQRNGTVPGAAAYVLGWYDRVVDRYGVLATTQANEVRGQASVQLAQQTLKPPPKAPPTKPVEKPIAPKKPPAPKKPAIDKPATGTPLPKTPAIDDRELKTVEPYQVVSSENAEGKDVVRVRSADGVDLWMATREATIVADGESDVWTIRATKDGLQHLIDKLEHNKSQWRAVTAKRGFWERLGGGLALAFGTGGGLAEWRSSVEAREAKEAVTKLEKSADEANSRVRTIQGEIDLSEKRLGSAKIARDQAVENFNKAPGFREIRDLFRRGEYRPKPGSLPREELERLVRTTTNSVEKAEEALKVAKDSLHSARGVAGEASTKLSTARAALASAETVAVTGRSLIKPGIIGVAGIAGIAAVGVGVATSRIEKSVSDIDVLQRSLKIGINQLNENPKSTYSELSQVHLPSSQTVVDAVGSPAFGTSFGNFDPDVPRLVPGPDGEEPEPKILR
jgi:uncharacterized protein YukE